MQQDHHPLRPKIITKNAQGETVRIFTGQNTIGHGTFGNIWSLRSANTALESVYETEISDDAYPLKTVVLKQLFVIPEEFEITKIRAQKEVDFLRRVYSDWSRDIILLLTEPLFIGFIMPQHPGKNLEMVDASKQLTLPLTLTGFYNLCIMIIEAITHIHNVDIVHLDLTPANIMVESFDPPLGLRIMDFGEAQKPGTLIDLIVDNPAKPLYRHLSSDRKMMTETMPVSLKKIPAERRHDFYSAVIIMEYLLQPIHIEDCEKGPISQELKKLQTHYDITLPTEHLPLVDLMTFFHSKLEATHGQDSEEEMFEMEM